MTKFIQHCGDCPKWKATEETGATQVLGMCSKYNQARHNQREMCKPMWDQEIKRLGKLVKAKESQIKIIMMERAVLDPKRTMESLGYKWPKEEKKAKKPKTTE